MYTDLEIDALKEIGNIGAGNAATALSMLLSKITISSSIRYYLMMSKSVGGPDNW